MGLKSRGSDSLVSALCAGSPLLAVTAKVQLKMANHLGSSAKYSSQGWISPAISEPPSKFFRKILLIFQIHSIPTKKEKLLMQVRRLQTHMNKKYR